MWSTNFNILIPLKYSDIVNNYKAKIKAFKTFICNS